MGNYKYKLNPITGQLNLVNDDGLLFFKSSVASEVNLPATGNNKNDAIIVNDTHNLYIWNGTIWENQGDIVDINWAAINNKPSSDVVDIDDAVTKKHTQGTDQTLDSGGINEVSVSDVKDSITKKHTQNTDESIILYNWSSTLREISSLIIFCSIEFNSKLYFGCESGYILEFDGTTWTSTSREPSSLNILSAIEFNGKLYFGCSDGYILEFDGTTWTSTLRLSALDIYCSIEFNSKLYFGCEGGYVLEFNGTSWTSAKRQQDHLRIICAVEFNNIIYFGCFGGYVLEFNGTSWTSAKRQVNNRNIRCGIESNSKLYFGCNNGQVLEFNGTSWTSTSREPSSLNIFSAIEFNSKLYFGCSGGQILEFDGTTWTSTSREPNAGAVYTSIESNSQLYFGCGVGYILEYISENITSINIDDAVTKKHTQNTDKYLDTQITNILYVDNKRTDSYTKNGSITKPFKTIQAANDAISGNSITNRFVIKIATGSYYSDILTLNKDFTTLEGYGETVLSGAITITSPHIRFANTKIIASVTLNLANHFLLEVVDCSVNTGVWNITATAPVGDEWFQISGDATIWKSNINANGITGVASIAGGYFEGIQTYTNCWVEFMGFETWGTINLEADTEATIGAVLPINAIVNLKTGAILNADATFLGGITLNNTGGTLNRITNANNVNNDSSVTGNTVKDALETLDIEKYKEGEELKIKVFVQDTEPTLNADNYMAIWHDTSVSGSPEVYLVYRRGTGDQVKTQLT